ncbi:hypothetical protein BZA05DRAFT_441265 [Tricharina praecox]|uniref:uncharacterized protein n=1 Tax=Tricharina praecox TaxID=43433 RepID=UPI00221E9A9B|nr:uncharacterized protein BZA05DRAFT_441265 [Tricharina praecox]KAI5857982.1 hypothetical protein BZA05DRAFT_441265 [Tricharina praecox]
MKGWVDKGYDISIGGQGACKDVFPEERRSKVEASEVFISIPDPREWDAYVDTLREEKLRALGVIPDDGPLTHSGSGGETPLSLMQSPAQHAMNMFSPPSLTASAMSNPHSMHPHGPFNPFSPISIPANGTPVPSLMSPGGQPAHLAFHLPRQSISATPSNQNDWDPYSGMYTPPIQQHTPPNMNGSGGWAPFTMRNGSPGMMNMPMHGHSGSQFNLGGYPMPMESPMGDPYVPHHGLVGQERFHHQQMRRGSPLAHVRHPVQPEPAPEAPLYPGLAIIDAPVPKHRHQLSVTLQKEFENTEAYQLEEARRAKEGIKEPEADGFATNPVSPVPVQFPPQPDMPNVEMDVHNGPELASNPDDDVMSDVEAEKQNNIHEAHVRGGSVEYPQGPYNVDLAPLHPSYVPQTQFPVPHSREQSLSQMQHEHETIDPIQNSAMSMMMIGEGMGGGNRNPVAAIHDELLSEDGRTNISDIVTNPSEPSSPERRFSNTASHAHHMSNTSATWTADHTKNALSNSSATKPKFNVNAAEFKFEPSFNFVPKGNAFTPTSQMAPVTSPESHTRDHSSGSTGGFGGFGAGSNASTFRPSLGNTSAYASIFEKGAAAFSPNAPEFTPSFAQATPPALPPASPPHQAAEPIFTEVVRQPPMKKAIPIVRPPSRESEAGDDRRDSISTESRKRVKHEPTKSIVNETEDSFAESLSPLSQNDMDNMVELAELEDLEEPSDHDSESENEDDLDDEDDEGEQLMKAPLEEVLGSFTPFEFRSTNDAESFANATPMNDYERPVPRSNGPEREILSPDEAYIAITAQTPSPSPSPQPFKFSASPSLKPTGQDFNFEFPSAATPPKKSYGIVESRYAHTPSPPPSEPAPSPPMPNSPFLPPRPATPYTGDVDPEKTEVDRPMPTDAELNEVIQYMDETNVVYLEQPSEQSEDDEDAEGEEVSDEDASHQGTISWQRNANTSRPFMPMSDEQTPIKQSKRLHSAGPSPSPRRADITYRHRASSFSPDEPIPAHALGGNPSAPPQEIRAADSDWDDMLSDEHGGKLRPQSRLFFDAHVEELVGGLFQRRLDPVISALATINDTLTAMSAFSSTRSLGEYATSDADDEEEDDTEDLVPHKTPRDRKLQKIKAALSEVLLAQRSGGAISEQNLEAIKDAVVNSSIQSHDFAEVKSAIADMLEKAAGHEDLSEVKTTLGDIAARVAQSAELVDLKATVSAAARETAQACATALQGTAKSQDMAAVRESVVTLRDTVRDAVDEIVTNVSDRVDDTKFALQDVLMRAAQRSDIAEVKAAIANSMNNAARKEDLIPLHNVLAETFSKSAKTDELVELNRILVEIMNTVTSNDIGPTHLEILRLKQENDQFGPLLHEVLRLTQDFSANMEFHQEAQQETAKEGQATLSTRISEVYSAVREMTTFVQSSASKGDMRRNLAEQGQKEDAAIIKMSIAETKLHIQELARVQPTLEDFHSVVDKVTTNQPKIDEFKSAMAEAVAATVPGLDDIKKSLRDIIKEDPTGVAEFKRAAEEDRQRNVEEFRTVVNQASLNNPWSQPSLDDFRALMEDVISKQQMFIPLNFDSPEDSDSKENLKLKIEALERDVALFQKRGDEEVERKRQWQEKTIELETKLKLAEEEAAKHREVAEEKDRRLKASDEKRHQTLTSAQMRSALLEGAHSSLQKSNGELAAKNAELEGAMREAQTSEEKHRGWNLQLENENKELRRAIEALKSETEESIKVRESFRSKFDRVQEDMRRLSLEIGQEQGKWRKTQEEQKARTEVLEAKLAAEISRSQGLEGEVRRLEVEEKESIRLRIETEQLHRATVKAEELITELRHESIENQSRIAQLTHEVAQARESAGDEVSRVRSTLYQEMDVVNVELSSVRKALETEVEKGRAEKERLERLLEETQISNAAALQQVVQEKAKALEEAAESKAAALEDQHRKNERQLDDERSQHERAYRIVTEDAERDQYFLQERLTIAQSETKNLRDHINSLQIQVRTLNENFKIANVAAQAAAQAATTVREMTAPNVSDERALRESVHVLQNQLQQRETRIDQLESELADVNINSSKLKEIEGQLNMYRELLDLRIDDLEEIIHTCNLPHLDRGSLRDAATRLRASLEMQLHEKERAMGITKPEEENTLASVSHAAAKLPGVASAAWQTWKNRGRTSGDVTPRDTPPSSVPSRPTSAASGFLNGILAPPSNTLTGARRFGAGFGRSNAPADVPSATPRAPPTVRAMEKRSTPYTGRRPIGSSPGPSNALFRKDNYDADADSSVLSGEFYDDDGDNATETGDDHGDMEPFGMSPYTRH